MRVSRLVAAIALASFTVSLTAACGSTVQVRSTATVSSDGLGLPPGASGPGASGTGTAGLAGANGPSTGVPGGRAAGAGASGAAGANGPSGATGGLGTTGGTGVVGGIAAKGRGWDAKSVYIGVVTQKDAQTAFQAVGVKGLDGGDQEGQAKAVTDEINRKGGLFGRTVVPVFHDVATVATAQDPSGTGQQTCTFFTQDQPVIAVFSPVTLMDKPAFRGCMQKAHVPVYSLTVQGIDSKVLDDLAPYYYSGIAPAWDSLAPVFAEQLTQMGFFTGWNPQTGTAGPNPVKTGVLVPDDTDGRRVGDEVISALAGVGQKNAVVYRYDPTNVSQGLSAAVINFAGNGVTHVITINADQLAFELSASSQNYKPRYGVTSYGAPQAELETNGPAGQNVGSMGVGWAPTIDVSAANDPGPTGLGAIQCLQIQKRGGQVFGDKRLAQAIAFGMCDGMLLFTRAAQLGGGLRSDQIYAGVRKAAPSFVPAISFGNGLRSGHLFMPGGVRRIAWVDGCSCFRYQSTTTYPIA